MLYLCMIAYVAGIYLRPNDAILGGIDIPVMQLLSAVAIAAAGCSLLLQPRRFWDVPHDKFVIGVWLAILMSNLSRGAIGGAFLGAAQFFKVVFYYFLMRLALREAWQLAHFIQVVVLLTVVLAVNGIVQFHTGTGLGNVGLDVEGRIRGVGIFSDPNDLALTFLVVVPFLIEDLLGRTQRFLRRLVAGVFLVLIVWAMFYANSRGGVVGLAVVLAAESLRRFGRMAGAVVAVLALAAVLVWGPSRVGMLDYAEESSQMRIQAWSAALVMFKSSPLFGVGFGRFTEFHERVAHNSFVHVFAELGLFGAFFWVGMCAWLLKSTAPGSAGEIPEETRRQRDALFVSALGLLTSASFLSRQYDHIFYTLVGLGACHTSITRLSAGAAEARTSARIALWIAALAIGGIVATRVAVRLFVRW